MADKKHGNCGCGCAPSAKEGSKTSKDEAKK